MLDSSEVKIEMRELEKRVNELFVSCFQTRGSEF